MFPRHMFRGLGTAISLILLALVISAFLVGRASAQSVSGALDIEWTLPVTGCTTGVTPCDKVPLSGTKTLTGIEVYLSTSPIADSSTMAPTLTLPATATTVNHTMTVTNGATIYVRVKAVNADGKSPFSAQETKPVMLPVMPGAPTSVTITLTITP